MLVELVDVRQALDNDGIVPCYQPIVDLRTGRLAGFEALARWRHPLLGMILPENFISVAEKNGLIGVVTERILRQALLTAPLLPKPLTLAVNVSPIQLRDWSLPKQIRHATEEAGFPLDRLTIEITESALVTNLSDAQKIASELKEMGCRLALDDFGTGFSSLRHLQALPFDKLKVDRSFVQDMTKARESRKIVAAIVGLGHSLDLITVGEGVETDEQDDMLLWLGCDQGQGWLYGRPVTIDEIPGLVAAPPRGAPVGLSVPGEGWTPSSLEAVPTQRLAQLQAIYDGAPVGLCFLDRDLRYVSINRRLAEINGVSVAGHLRKTVQEIIPEAFAAIEPYLIRALKGEAIEDVEIIRPGIKPGDPDRIMRSSYQPARDEANEVIGVSVAVMDVSGQRRTEAALRDSEELQRQMFEINPQTAWMMDPEGNNLEVSSRWVENLPAIGKPGRKFGWLGSVHKDDLEPTVKAMEEALRAGHTIDIEYRVRNADGEWTWMRSRGSPRLGLSGEVLRWYGIVENIHERKLWALITATLP